MERINKEITLCGKCFEVCPYTIEYINREDTVKQKNDE
jgi:epoxyqueuosine reductase QueG